MSKNKNDRNEIADAIMLIGGAIIGVGTALFMIWRHDL
jgi:hypothetical protein